MDKFCATEVRIKLALPESKVRLMPSLTGTCALRAEALICKLLKVLNRFVLVSVASLGLTVSKGEGSGNGLGMRIGISGFKIISGIRRMI